MQEESTEASEWRGLKVEALKVVLNIYIEEKPKLKLGSGLCWIAQMPYLSPTNFEQFDIFWQSPSPTQISG